ncbi:hypothetical protein BDR22DRAFT_435450 [Usnea florida]
MIHGSDMFNFSFILPHFSTTMLLIHFMVFALALAAPLEKTMPKNLTASSRCTRSQDWQAYAFLVEDCYTAIQRLYIEEVLKKPDAIYEFITVGTYPRTLHPWMRTPIEYTVNSCTLSIVMLNLFGHKESLPGRGAVNFHHSDTASFKDIYRAARLVEKDCLLPDRLPGWEAVGKT